MNDREAAGIVTEAWRRVHGRPPTLLERTYAQAIARFETGYGRAGQFGAMAARGQFNWGAEQRRRLPTSSDEFDRGAEQRRRGADGGCPEGFASGSDQGPVCFFVFPDDVSAATAFVRTLTKTRWPTVPAMRGAPEDVATAMRKAPAYYAGVAGSEADKIRAYADGIRRNALAIARTVPTPPLPSGLPGGALPWIVGLGLAGGAAYLYADRFGVPAPVEKAIDAVRRKVGV